MKEGHKQGGGQAVAEPERPPQAAPVAVPSPRAPLTPARVVALQRLVGNAAVSALVDDRRGFSADATATISAPLGPSILDDLAAATESPAAAGDAKDAATAQDESSAAAPESPAAVPESPAGADDAKDAAATPGESPAAAAESPAAAPGESPAAATAGPPAAAAHGALAGDAKAAAAGGSSAPASAIAGGPKGSAGGSPAAAGEAKAAASPAAAETSSPASAGAAVKDPHADPRFQAMKAKTATAAHGAKAHEPAASGAAAAQAAAVPPGNELASQAQAAQVDTMSEQKPGAFDRAGFIAAVRAAIEKTAPKNLEEADDFKADGVKEAVTGQVKQGKDGAQKDIKGATDQAPDPGKGTPKQVTPLQPEPPGQAPASVGAASAMPQPATPEETDLSQGPKQVDQQMADAQVTDEQIQKSNEPEFKSALTARDAAKEHAGSAPDAYRKTEQAELAKAHGGAEAAEVQHLAGMHQARGGALAKVTGHKQGAKSQDEAARAKVATDIQGIYDRTKSDVTRILDGLDGKVDNAFTAGEAAARKKFEDSVAKRMDAYKDDRYSGWRGKLRWVKDKFAGLPSEVNQFYADGKTAYLADMDQVIGKVADVVGAELAAAKARIAQGKAEVHKYVTELPQNLKQVGKDAESNLQAQFEELASDVDSKQNELVDTLAKKYVDARGALDARIDEMKAANRGLIDKAIDAIGGVIKTILQLKNMLMGVLAKAADVIGDIISDPIGFLGKLIDGIKSGLNRFVGNIAKHLEEGLMGWLFGALGSAGIAIPKTFDLAGIVDLVLQVLGLTYQSIRARVVKLVGEPIVQRMEQTVDVFKTLATEGVAGLWKWLKDRVGDLEDLVLGQIKTFIIEKVIKAGVVWLIAFLNPAAAFIKACKAIYDIVMFLIERGSEIMDFVSSILDSLGSVAKGAIGIVAEKVEGSLAKALPLAITFLADLLGLGGISEKIHQVIDKVRSPITKAVDFIVLGAVKGARKLFGRATGWVKGKYKQGKEWVRDKAQGVKDRFTRGGAKQPGDAKDADAAAPVVVPFSMHGKPHKLIAQGGPRPRLEMHSTPAELVDKIETMYDALTRTKAPDNEGTAALRQEMIQESHVLLSAAMKLWEDAASNPELLKTELPALAAQISAFGERFDRRDIDAEAAEAAKARRKALVTNPVPLLFEGINPASPPRGWTFTDRVIERGPYVTRVETEILDPVGGKGTIRREYDRKAKKWTLSSAFLDELEAWIPASVPMSSRGINLITYATLRQQKIAKAGPGDVSPGAIKRQKWSTIVNERTMLQLAKLNGNESGRDALITSTHSWTYAMTALTQARYRVVPGTQRVLRGEVIPIRKMDSFAKLCQSGKEAEAAAKLAKLDPSLTLDTLTWYGFNIEAEVEPIP